MGHVASGDSISIDNYSIRRWLTTIAPARLLAFVLLVLAMAIAVAGQSGRRKSDQQKTPSPIDTTSAEKTTQAQDSPGTDTQKKGSDKTRTDDDDVVRVSYNLVPVPTSLIDTRSYVVADLN